MSCNKCTQTFALEEKKATIYWMSDLEELQDKTHKFLQSLKLDIGNKDGLMYIDVENVHTFFESNIDALAATFNTLEREDIKLHIQYEGQTFSFQSVVSAKALSRYMSIIDDKEFFDIINNESLTSYFQPIIDANTQEIYGYEALIRGVKEDGSLMFPDVLFDKSARNDLNFKLDRMFVHAT
jgi:sensor c-di-GMP phosphodiesterase-like protein